MRYLIIGLGSIGRRHLANIRRIDPQGTIIVWHTRPHKSAAANKGDDGDQTVYSFDDAVRPKPNLALITTPSTIHLPIAKQLAEEQIDIFIEKPLSINLEGISELLALAKTNDTRIIMGYNFRCHYPLQLLKECIDDGRIGKVLSIRAEVGQYLPEWRPGIDYRKSVSARCELGGGAILELSHELDYVRWFAGEVTEVTAMADHVSDLAIDVEDMAEIVLRFANGAIGNVHVDMLQRIPNRSCRVIGSEGTLTWDGNTDGVMLYTADSGKWTIIHPPKKVDRNMMYVEEIRQAVRCVMERGVPACSGEDGRRVLEIALAALHSSREGRNICL